MDKFDNVSIIAVDNSPEAIDKMEKLADEYSNLTFISGDVRRHEILLKAFRLAQKCDILSVDLGGDIILTLFLKYFIFGHQHLNQPIH